MDDNDNYYNDDADGEFRDGIVSLCCLFFPILLDIVVREL